MWAKGQSGNPGGRPKRDRIISQRILAELTDYDGAKLHRLANALLERALGGDITAIREVIDRVEGKPTQALEHEGTFQFDHVSAREELDKKLAEIALRLTASNAEPETPIEHFVLAVARQRAG